MKTRPVEAEFHTADGRPDRQTNMTKLIATFRDFANVPEKLCVLPTPCTGVFVWISEQQNNDWFL
jgi:hypothetical protein